MSIKISFNRQKHNLFCQYIDNVYKNNNNCLQKVGYTPISLLKFLVDSPSIK